MSNKTNTKVTSKVTTPTIEIPSTLTTTSSKIRYLHSQGLTRSQIAKLLNKRYQHIRNVLIEPLKKPTN